MKTRLVSACELPTFFVFPSTDYHRHGGTSTRLGDGRVRVTAMGHEVVLSPHQRVAIAV